MSVNYAQKMLLWKNWKIRNKVKIILYSDINYVKNYKKELNWITINFSMFTSFKLVRLSVSIVFYIEKDLSTFIYLFIKTLN